MLLGMIATSRADLTNHPASGILWLENFQPLTVHVDPYTGWSAGTTPSCAITVQEGALALSEIGQENHGNAMRYVPFDLVTGAGGFPYLQILVATGSAGFSVANASTGGAMMADRLSAPGLFSFDLRQVPGLKERTSPGFFALVLTALGPAGRTPGPAARLSWIRTTASDLDHIQAKLEDAQVEKAPGYGLASVGDKIQLSLNTSARCKKVVFRILDAKTGKPLLLDGRTEFPAPYDPDSMGRSWLATIPLTEKSQSDFKTWTVTKGDLQAGNTRILITADVEGGTYPALFTTPSFGFDLMTGRAAGGSAGADDPQTLLQGAVLMGSNFDQGADPNWRIVSGNEWVSLRKRFGDTSDSPGPDELGVWASAGEAWWSDYTVSLDVAEVLDGMGEFFLAARFQDPRNYYALEWTSNPEGSGHMLLLVRCFEGQRYEIARAKGVSGLDKLPFRLSLSVSGDYLTASLNDQQMLAGYAGDFPSGPVAIGGISRKILVDNVLVTRLVSQGKKQRFLSDFKFQYALAPRYFLRDTGKLDLPFTVTNAGTQALEQVRLDIVLSGPGAPAWGSEAQVNPSGARLAPPLSLDIARLEPGARMTVRYPIDTRRLKSGEYLLHTRASLAREGLVRDETLPIGIARNWNPDRFNYLTWGPPDDEAGIRDYAEHGHTLALVNVGGRGSELEWEHLGQPVPETKQPNIQSRSGLSSARFSLLDYCLKYGIIGGVNLQSNSGSHFPEEVRGKFKNNVHGCVLPYHPRFREFSLNFARTYARKFGAYPACRLFGINTETEFELQPDFSEVGLERANRLFGGPPPEGAETCDGLPGDQVPGLVTDGVVNEEHPVARYYRWFWNEGEGYNVLARDMAAVIREVNPAILTFHDPAARGPAIRDRHDGLNSFDWTYTNPNALTLPYKTEVLRAMAKPPFDAVCNYVQVLWKKGVVSPQDECPSAAILRLGLLYSASRPVYSGHWNTDWMRAEAHLDRWEAVKDLNETLWKPLGPVLTKLTDPPREIAFMISYNNLLFQYLYRMNTWSAEIFFAAWHEAFLRAGLSVDIVFEEDVAEGKLAKYKAVFIPGGQLIGRTAYDQLLAYAKQGGRVVADRHLGYKVPGVETLATDLQPMDYPNWAYSAGRKLSAQGQVDLVWQATDEIARVFAESRSRVPTGGDKWLVVNERKWHDTRYVFAVNDHRSAGTQVGQHGVMFENGEPLTATVTMPGLRGAHFVYDLVERGRVAARETPAGLTWEKAFAPASGTLFAVLPQEIAGLELSVPERPVPAGESFTVSARLLDISGKPVRGRLPLRLTIRDAQGSVSEYSDVFAFENGAFSKTGWIAANDLPGSWSVRVDDLATGRFLIKYFKTLPVVADR
jgi:hypothetical protein